VTGAEIVGRFAAAGLLLRRDGDGIVCRGPAGALTPELRALVSSNRDDVLAALTTYPCSSCGRFAFPRPTVCYSCRRDSGA
jgi:hypothetical protein